MLSFLSIFTRQFENFDDNNDNLFPITIKQEYALGWPPKNTIRRLEYLEEI